MTPAQFYPVVLVTVPGSGLKEPVVRHGTCGSDCLIQTHFNACVVLAKAQAATRRQNKRAFLC